MSDAFSMDLQIRFKKLMDEGKNTAARMFKAHGYWFLFLPAYSPDLNPIEMAFFELKADLSRIGARTFNQLIEAIGKIYDFFTSKECWNFFKVSR